MKDITTFFLLLTIAVASSAQLTIRLNSIPVNTPPDDNIYIAGDFQGWDPGSADHILSKDSILNLFQITLPPGTQSIQFKFTRGTWAKVESDANGSYIPNRTYTSKANDTITLQILGWEDLDGNGGGTSTAAENVSVLNESFYMTQLDRSRRIWIYLPPDYENSSRNYPVLYMQDGQNLFDDLTSFIGEWHVDETLNELYAGGDSGIIVVGIDNGGTLRMDEYAPWVNNTYGGGEGDAYVNFLVNELKPYIDANFRTLAGRENTGIMGSSLGALISLYAGIKFPEVFGKIGSFSPAYWFNPEIFEWLVAQGKKQDMKIYQLAGGLEGESVVNNMAVMTANLYEAGFSEEELYTLLENDGQHSEWFWAREFEDAYLWLFRGNPNGLYTPANRLTDYHLYPNPVKDELHLDFNLGKSSMVKIGIVDSLGALKFNSYSGYLESGKHQLQLNPDFARLAPGTYFCRIISGDGQAMLKFVLEE